MSARFAGALVALALLVPAGAQGAVSPRIVNGQPATTQQLPFLAGLQIAVRNQGDDGPDALCGGSLIAARWILTAAHCLAEEDVDYANSYAILGATNLNAATDEQRYQFAEGFVPESYATGNGGFDVGLIRLARPAPEAQLRLLRPRDAGRFAAGTNALTAGWGYTEDPEDGGQLSTGQLRSVQLQITADQACESSFDDAGQGGQLDFSTEICAIAPNKDSCNGDSGGPLLVDDGHGLYGLAGAVSFGIGNGSLLRGNRSCNEGPPGVYSKVGADPLNSFIRERVPQVEIDANVETPVPGERVTFTARPNAPGGSGRFGGYSGLAWDLNGDGVFNEKRGRRAITLPVRTGVTQVSVRATTGAGDAEVRTVRVSTQAKSAVAFTRASARVRAGHSVALRVRRIGSGAGTVRLTVSGHGVSPHRRILRFTGSEAARTVRLRAGRNASRTVKVRLGAFSGDVVAGAQTTLRLRVQR